MIFVTLGSQKFQFNRLLKKIDELVEEKVITEKVFAQIGYSDYIPKNYEYEKFLNREDFAKKMKESNIVITHGGTGAIIGAVKAGNKVMAVPRLAKYGEHVDDHQLQLLKEFEEMGIIEVCYNLNKMKVAYENLLKKEYKNYISNTQTIMDSIEEYLLERKNK